MRAPARGIPAFGASGLVVLVAGTFLPWLRSGQVRRNSYQAGGALQRLLGVHGVLDSAVSAWPFVGLLCAGIVATYAIGCHRCAALLALIVALFTGAVALAALRIGGNRILRAAALGPSVTLLGALAVLAAATLLLTSRASSQRRKGARHDPTAPRLADR